MTLSEKVKWVLEQGEHSHEINEMIKDHIAENESSEYDNDWNGDFKIYFQIDRGQNITNGRIDMFDETLTIPFNDKIESVVQDWYSKLEEEVKEEISNAEDWEETKDRLNDYLAHNTL